MTAGPLCQLVLSMLAAEPRRAHEVARELHRRSLGPPAAGYATLTRLQSAGLVHPRGRRFKLTARGRRELALQRLLWTL